MRSRTVPAVIAVMATATLVVAACSSSPSSSDPGGSSSSASAVAYSQCMRSNGVPAYPDPDGSGNLPKIVPANESQLGVTDSQFNSAQKACQSLWPYQAPTQAQQHQELTDDLKFAQCMRSHGLPNFPDPTTDPQSGRVEFVISASSGLDLNSPQLLAKAHECESVLPPGAGLPSATQAP